MDQAGAERAYRVAAAIGLLVGIAALLSPSLLVRVYGVREEQNGIGKFGWRLFAIRNIYLASLSLAGNRTARDAVMYLQPPDVVVFLHSHRAGELPLATTVLACLSAGAVLGTSALAKSAK